eukprot:TRINITY_DN64637_c0_g1_i1.p1 TRINITY_DN64637_c0_g1~~TRINITY_DN64637_c0_g1_i1.p1  ORF type:complete len:837 (-),score=199.67 TRINITY_DN64637_c0_g1_i1:293-2803(-)
MRMEADERSYEKRWDEDTARQSNHAVNGHGHNRNWEASKVTNTTSCEEHENADAAALSGNPPVSNGHSLGNNIEVAEVDSHAGSFDGSNGQRDGPADGKAFPRQVSQTISHQSYGTSVSKSRAVPKVRSTSLHSPKIRAFSSGGSVDDHADSAAGKATRINSAVQRASSVRSSVRSSVFSVAGGLWSPWDMMSRTATDPYANDASREAPKATFITVQEEGDELDEELQHQPVRRVTKAALKSAYLDSTIGIIIVMDFLVICRDTDVQASGEQQERWVTYAMALFFLLYISEWLTRLFVYRLRVFESNGNNLDLAVICISVIEYALQWSMSTGSPSTLILLRMIRLCRLLRLLRVIKLFKSLKELRRLMQMMSTCAKTLFWSFLMCGLVMCIWSVLAVELVNPIAMKLEAEGLWPDCDRCGRAFSTVVHANLTFFQTVLAGDSWGLLAVPIIEDSPYTASIFIGVVLTILFGVMQMITAVVVDTFADLRKNDVNSLVQEIDAEEIAEKKMLAKIFDKIDEDKSGAVSYDELEEGARRVNEFRNWLRVMDIDAQDLWQLFQIIDEDGSGEIDPTEFIDALYRMKNTDSKTATKFVKHIVEGLEKRQGEMALKMEGIEGMMEQQITSAASSEPLSARHAVRTQGKRLTTKGSRSLGSGNSAQRSPAGFQRSSSPAAASSQSEADEDRAAGSFIEGVQAHRKSVVTAVESAVRKATEVALEAAMKAALEKTKEVMDVSMKSSAAIAHKAGESMRKQSLSAGKEYADRIAAREWSVDDVREADGFEVRQASPMPVDWLPAVKGPPRKERGRIDPPASFLKVGIESMSAPQLPTLEPDHHPP